VDSTRFGRQLRALRIRKGLRQRDVAAAARVSRPLISKIEHGAIDTVTIGTLLNASRAVEAVLDVRLRWHGEQLDRLLDEAHAALVETVVGTLSRYGWKVAVEVSFSIWGERGSIDVLAFHEARGVLLVVEVKSVVPDNQAAILGLDRKSRLAPGIAAERGWHTRAVAKLLVVSATATSRRRVARLRATFDAAFPIRGAEVRSWLRSPAGSISGLLFVPYVTRGDPRRGRPGLERVRRPRRALEMQVGDSNAKSS
jgi:transcriptional regulator with XRE-family HTH domain